MAIKILIEVIFNSNMEESSIATTKANLKFVSMSLEEIYT
jgi:hypothetical protein